MAISIHAPTRGATMRIGATQVVVTFQSTLPQGERRDSGAHGTRLRNFNPRSHKGSDHKLRTKFFSMPISIHAPTRGATKAVLLLCSVCHISIHAPTRGATLLMPIGVSMDCQFQSTLPQGERRRSGSCPLQVLYFNPRSHKGSDRGLGADYTSCTDFNPRSHKGSDK